MNYQSKPDVVSDELRNRIATGALAPGEVLNQEQLAADLGVSTTPLREALRRLEVEQLVVIAAHRAVFVAKLSQQELNELYEARIPLDSTAGYLAALRKDSSDVVAIRFAASEARLAGKVGEDTLDLNRAFHRSIYKASHNRVLISLLDGLWTRSERYRRAVRVDVLEPRVIERQIGEHDAICRAILSCEADEASALLRSHLKSSKPLIAEFIEVPTAVYAE